MVSGVLVALATPLDERGELDRAGLERLLERVLAGGVSGICPCGSTGEGPRLGRARRLAVAVAVRSAGPPGLPVIPAPAAQTAEEAVEELEALAERGADAALLAPPAYYPLGDAGVRRFYEAVADRSPLPLLIYNIPAFTGVPVAPTVVGALAAHPRIAGIKDSSRDAEYFTAVCHATADAAGFARLTGSDTLLLASVVVGADGTIAASANLVPQLGCALHRAAVEQRWDDARELQRRLFAVVSACRVGEPPAGWKAALDLAGVCSGRLAAPGSALDGAARERLRERLAALDLP
jgi:4-hydroxy-tetrahydrodipicolinate synthase